MRTGRTCPTTGPSTTRSRSSGRNSSATLRQRRPSRTTSTRVQRRAALRAWHPVVEGAPLARRPDASALSRHVAHIEVADRAWIGRILHAPPAAGIFASGRPFKSRIAFAAAHVVCDPLREFDAEWQRAHRWGATLAFRRHLWAHGFAVAEAWIRPSGAVA